MGTEWDWDTILIEASIAAMQGIQESGKIGVISDLTPNILAAESVKIAKCLVEELKKEISQK